MTKKQIPYGQYCYDPSADEKQTTCVYYESAKEHNKCMKYNYVAAKTDYGDLFNEKCKICPRK